MSRSILALVLLAACSKPYGPENEWFHAEERDVPEELAGTGKDVGDTLDDFTYVDQHGDPVQLYQFYGQVVQLVIMAQWCPPCQDEAPALEQASVDLAEQGVTIIELMLENTEGAAPGSEDCAEWATEYGATHPILAEIDDFHVDMIEGGYPTLPVLDRQMRVAKRDNWPFDAGFLETLAAEPVE